MNLIEQIESQIQNEIEHAKVSEEAFDLWKSNEVTKLFMASMKESYLDYLQQQPTGTIEQVFALQIQRKAMCDALEQFIDWNPVKD